MFWTHVSTVISTALEVLVLHWVAAGSVAVHEPAAWWADAGTVAWLLTMPYWRISHFYWLHRGMHPWYTTTVPDLGALLYKWVHSLHHTAKNPTSWSGVSMHPVESSLYYTAALVPVLAGPWLSAALARAGVPLSAALLAAHPLVFLYTKIDLTAAALIGHDGVEFP